MTFCVLCENTDMAEYCWNLLKHPSYNVDSTIMSKEQATIVNSDSTDILPTSNGNNN